MKMNSIRFKITAIALAAVLVAMLAVFAASYPSIQAETERSSVEMMRLIGENTKSTLDEYFVSVEQAVNLAANMAVDSLDSVTLVECGAAGTYARQNERTQEQTERLDAYIAGHCEKVLRTFESAASHTNGIITYYYCINPEISGTQHGFYYSRIGKAGFVEQEPLDAAGFDAEDPGHNVWYATTIKRGRPSWIGLYPYPPMGEIQLCSYVVPIYCADTLIGVLGMDIPLESITDQLKQNWWSQKFYDHTVKDVTVTDEDVQARYDALLAEQQADFDATPENFEYAHLTGRAIVYRPEGYRSVRDVLIPFESEEDAAKAADLLEDLEMIDEDPDALAETKKALDALFAPLEAKAAEAQQKLTDGAGFADLMNEYGTSDALKDEPLRSEGFYITDTSFVNSAEFVEGAMMLEQPGQVSSPLRSQYGIHLVEYVAELTPGAVPLDQVRDAVAADALSAKQAEYYDQQRKTLLEQAHVKYYPERLH